MKSYPFFCKVVIGFFVLILVACGGIRKSAIELVPGHYTYQHGWTYDEGENHIVVHETGTMDYYKDGTALDSARQVYRVTHADGTQTCLVFNYISPSVWKVEGDDFFFGGIEEAFRMAVVEDESFMDAHAQQLAQHIIQGVRKSIGHETKFHLAEITRHKLTWSYTYPDRHTDTWEFFR